MKFVIRNSTRTRTLYWKDPIFHLQGVPGHSSTPSAPLVNEYRSSQTCTRIGGERTKRIIFYQRSIAMTRSHGFYNCCCPPLFFACDATRLGDLCKPSGLPWTICFRLRSCVRAIVAPLLTAYLYLFYYYYYFFVFLITLHMLLFVNIIDCAINEDTYIHTYYVLFPLEQGVFT